MSLSPLLGLWPRNFQRTTNLPLRYGTLLSSWIVTLTTNVAPRDELSTRCHNLCPKPDELECGSCVPGGIVGGTGVAVPLRIDAGREVGGRSNVAFAMV